MWKDSKQNIIDAHQRIKPYIHRTPVLTNNTIQKRAACAQLYFKCENLQKVGAFKPRGAFNKLLQLNNPSSVCTHSSGNHAQGVAYAAMVLKIPAYIVMPQNSPNVKREAVKGYGATVIESGNTTKEREDTAQKIAAEHNSVMVHPYDDLDIITGQATVAKEVFEQIPNLDYLLLPIGGGGLISGAVLSAKYFGGHCKVIGVEPYLARDAKESLQKDAIQAQYPPISIGDGLRTNLGKLPFEILREHLKPDDVILVSEDEIIRACQLVLERMKVVIEPSSATVVAALLKDERFKGKRVCCVLSGGNIDMASLFDFLRTQIKE